MVNIEFEWDTGKARLNKQKHKVSFEVATRVFSDPFRITEQDRFENGEYRWQTIGMVNNEVILLVAHTIIDIEYDTEIVRIISARKATNKEKKRYDNG